MAYQLWRRNHDIESDVKISWRGKLSTLSRAYIHASEVGVPDAKPDQYPHQSKLPMQIARLPHPINKSPFGKWMEPTQEEILNTLDERTTVIFVDGSCKPDPGIGGAGLVIQDPSQSQWIEVKFPIQGITTMIGSEIEAIRQALKYVQHKDERVVILSDCKFAVNAIHNKSNSETYNFSIADCQQLMKELGENDVPEIYWIKGHSGIPGNERADAVAKSARFQAEFNQPEFSIPEFPWIESIFHRRMESTLDK
ncbi:ribonuclease H [Reticulomyxa filosa]|uniref:ribonuclease H n=1 Tax=Reticulomyxa filosa TaxID=46433 RepID=X6LJM0_RETFI|nr:ribonuclease H [Reticulomyxa filosa]|eukprot:ETO02158.1 ribonuclease H [Reticulomyxa filosa]